jgi:hypothetical protein
MRLETQRFYRADWTDEEAYENVGQETWRLYIQEIPNSNLGPETGYPDCEFGSFQSLQANVWIVP